MESIKIVLTGDDAVGKTSLLITYITKSFPREYVPTVFDGYSANITIDESTSSLCILDTAGQGDYDRLRPLSYPGTDVFLTLFSVVDEKSYHNVKTKWMPEISHHCPDVPRILVGSKIDLRDDVATLDKLNERNERVLEYDDGVKMAEECGYVEYVECSALTRDGMSNVFDVAIRCVVIDAKRRPKIKKRYGGCLMM